MQMTIKGVNYYYQWLFGYNKQFPTLVCLHGFTGSSQTFLSIFKEAKKYNILLIDLVGHGKTSSLVHPYQYQFTTVCEAIVSLTKTLGLGTFSLFGYSMGARVALGVASLFPSKVENLILESGSPGLENKAERQQRQKSDQKLAQFIFEYPLEAFVDKWENLELFKTQKQLPQVIQTTVRNERLGQEKFGLICSLWFMGTGVQPNFWGGLSQLAEIPTLLIVGRLDSKFVTIAEKMCQLEPKIEVVMIENAGHCVHLEQPSRVEKEISKKMLKGAD